MAATPKHSVSVAGIVVGDDDRVLVIRRDDNGHWEAPGGVLELDESFEDGVRREVLEETGLTSRWNVSPAYTRTSPMESSPWSSVAAPQADTHPTAEAREVRWMTTQQVQSTMNPAFAVRVLDAFDATCIRVPTTESTSYRSNLTTACRSMRCCPGSNTLPIPPNGSAVSR